MVSDQRGVAVIGAGGHGKVVVSALQACGEPIAAVFDRDPARWGERLLGVPIVGGTDRIRSSGLQRAVLAIGDNRTRQELASRLEVEWATVVHPSACLHASVQLGPGSVVFAGAVIQPDTVIGKHCIVNTGVSVDHDCSLGDFVHLAPGARLAGGVSVDSGALVGIGASVVPGIHIGTWATVGAGAAVVGDVHAGATVKGVPAH